MGTCSIKKKFPVFSTIEINHLLFIFIIQLYMFINIEMTIISTIPAFNIFKLN